MMWYFEWSVKCDKLWKRQVSNNLESVGQYGFLYTEQIAPTAYWLNRYIEQCELI